MACACTSDSNLTDTRPPFTHLLQCLDAPLLVEQVSSAGQGRHKVVPQQPEVQLLVNPQGVISRMQHTAWPGGACSD